MVDVGQHALVPEHSIVEDDAEIDEVLAEYDVKRHLYLVSATVFLLFAADIAASLGGDPAPDTLDYPTVRDGAAGVHFIETALESSRQEAWLDARYDPPGA